MTYRNIQVIDGALNCTFSIFQATEEEFALIFPDPGQDIQYIEDLPESPELTNALAHLWEQPILKRDVSGLHGTLFFGLQNRKEFYSGNAENRIDDRSINSAQRLLFAKDS